MMNFHAQVERGLKQQSGCGGVVVLLFFAIFWSSITCLFLGMMGYGMLRQTQALGYPSTRGTITEIDVKRGTGKNKSKTLKIKYRYEVGGKQFTAERYRYGMANTSDNWATHFARQHPPGTPVTVFYNAYDPGDAVLKTGIEGMDLVMLIFMTPFTLVMLGIWWACWVSFKPKPTELVAGGLSLVDHGGDVAITMPSISPLAVALGVLGLSAFAMIFLVVFTVGARPAMWVGMVAWGVLLLAAGVAYVLAAKSRWQGRHDLQLDRMRRTVTLPANLGRKDHAIISFDEISGIGVQGPIYKGKKNATPKQQVVVYKRNPGGSTDSYPIAEFDEETPAESLAEFLRTELSRKL